MVVVIRKGDDIMNNDTKYLEGELLQIKKYRIEYDEHYSCDN